MPFEYVARITTSSPTASFTFHLPERLNNVRICFLTRISPHGCNIPWEITEGKHDSENGSGTSPEAKDGRSCHPRAQKHFEERRSKEKRQTPCSFASYPFLQSLVAFAKLPFETAVQQRKGRTLENIEQCIDRNITPGLFSVLRFLLDVPQPRSGVREEPVTRTPDVGATLDANAGRAGVYIDVVSMRFRED